ncbi:MAG: bifunctional ADP-heptose synthase [Planctomycetota bacterium]
MSSHPASHDGGRVQGSRDEGARREGARPEGDDGPRSSGLSRTAPSRTGSPGSGPSRTEPPRSGPGGDAHDYLEVLHRFEGCRIGVVGDMVADVYVLGQPQRLSREAPVIIIRWESETTLPGSAANTVANLAALSARVTAVAVLGNDPAGRMLRDRLGQLGVDLSGLLLSDDMGTVTKTRILAGDHNRTKQQVIRIDREPQAVLPEGVVEIVQETLEVCDRSVDAWIVSDYDYGLIDTRVIAQLNGIAKRKPVIVDSHRRLGFFRGVTLVTPNEEEALGSVAGVEAGGDPAVAGRLLLKTIGSQGVLVTRGNRGMVLLERDGHEVSIPIVGTAEVVDVSGAGDTVTATAGLALVAGASMEQAARLANLAASVVVMRTGAATCTRQELCDRLRLI